ncbi:MAG TPA: hypothetical protein DEP72_02515 [Clostridiales bacterium]|nr:MAG: hypothetical protein A2Y18_06085 [Clostridiales bacterium GWD2_32_19]HCC07029.1 hypothetical protein [Clostridiales bacterium]
MEKLFGQLNQTTLLTVIHRLVTVIFYFVNSFLVVYFLKATNWNIKIISIYYIISYIAMFVCFYTLGYYITNKGVLKLYRIGIIFQLVQLFIVLYLKKDIATFMIPLGILAGIVGGCYWIPRHLLVYSLNKSSKVSKFFCIDVAIDKIQTILIPIVMGGIIGLSNNHYSPLIMILIGILSLALSFSTLIDIKEIDVHNLRISKIKEFLQQSKFDKIGRMYISEFFSGLTSSGILSIVVVILTFHMYKSELNLGIYNSSVAFITVIVMIGTIKYLKDSNFKVILEIMGILTLFVCMMLIYMTNDVTFLIFNIITGISFSVIQIVGDSNIVKLLRQKETKKYILENIILRDLSLNVGRVIGFSILFYASDILNNINSMRIVLAFITIGIVMRIVFMNGALMIKDEHTEHHLINFKYVNRAMNFLLSKKKLF